MAYQIYFADLTEENKSLLLTLLRLKEESGRLDPGEAELLAQLRGPMPFPVRPPEPVMAEPTGDQQRGFVRRPNGRRRFEGGRPHQQEQHPEQRQERRQEQRPEPRSEPRPNPQAFELRPELRPESRDNTRPEHRPEPRPEPPTEQPFDPPFDRRTESAEPRIDPPDEPRAEPA